jgi:ribosomal protein L20A (L18A)
MPAKRKDTMKLYRVTGIAKSDQGTTRFYTHPLASGISTRQAADRIVAELASQGAINLDVQPYTEKDEVDHAA